MGMLADHEASGSGNDVRTLLRMLVQPMHEHSGAGAVNPLPPIS
jgi:hypothetical protein